MGMTALGYLVDRQDLPGPNHWPAKWVRLVLLEELFEISSGLCSSCHANLRISTVRRQVLVHLQVNSGEE